MSTQRQLLARHGHRIYFYFKINSGLCIEIRVIVWLSNYLSLRNGIPNADTFERILEMLDPNIIAEKMRWLLKTDEIAGKIIAFDGKTMRGSKSENNRGFHVLSAFLTDAQIVLGEITCDEKSNEITAIPELLDTINAEKSIVTIDAMGTQTKIAEKIIAKKVDYCLALKGNQSSIHDDVRLYFETETRYFLTSLSTIDDFARAVRGHWGIENCLHWHLDVTFG